MSVMFGPLVNAMPPTTHTQEPWQVTDDGLSIVAGGEGAARGSTIIACSPSPMTWRPEDARRIVACVNACRGIPTAQLEAMNAHALGLLARAYDVCSGIVEVWRHELEDDSEIPGADAVDTLTSIGEDALAVCRWALDDQEMGR